MTDENPSQAITIDGTPYQIDQLSKQAQSQIINLRATDAEIERLQRLLAICQTARATYANALRDHLAAEAKPAAH